MLELHHLSALASAVRTGSLTAAARELHVTQSALSHLLGDLERVAGVRLLDRSRRPLTPTAAGRRVCDCAEAVLPLVRAAEEDLARIRQGTIGRLLISLECHSCIEWLAPAMARYRSAQPAVDLDLRLGASFDPLPPLRAGAVDLVITGERTEAPGILGEPLFRYDIVGVVPAGHRLAEKPFLEPRDFAGATVITYPVAECRLDLYTRFLEPAGVVPAGRRTAELTAMIIQWVASGQGLAALPSWSLPPAAAQVVALPLGRRGLSSGLHALRRASDRGAAHLDAFTAILRAHPPRALRGRGAASRAGREFDS